MLLLKVDPNHLYRSHMASDEHTGQWHGWGFAPPNKEHWYVPLFGAYWFNILSVGHGTFMFSIFFMSYYVAIYGKMIMNVVHDQSVGKDECGTYLRGRIECNWAIIRKFTGAITFILYIGCAVVVVLRLSEIMPFLRAYEARAHMEQMAQRAEHYSETMSVRKESAKLMTKLQTRWSERKSLIVTFLKSNSTGFPELIVDLGRITAQSSDDIEKLAGEVADCSKENTNGLTSEQIP